MITTTTSLIAVAACGGDDDGASGTTDAAVVIDSGPLPDARDPGSSFYKLSCAADPEYDAGPPADAGPDVDAGPQADAGLTPPPGTGDPCCDPEGVCPSGLECIGDMNMENATCRPVCIGDDNLQCPFGGVCANFAGQHICIPASGEGDECAPELCEPGLICVGENADSAVCKKKCTGPDDCADGEECLPVSNGTMACQ